MGGCKPPALFADDVAKLHALFDRTWEALAHRLVNELPRSVKVVMPSSLPSWAWIISP